MTGVLDGVTVVALEQAVAGPFATRQLADLGARVIKLERPGSGDFARGYDETVRGLSSHFVWLNRCKESLTLDLKHPAADDVLTNLLAGADVLVHNLAPGAAERLGCGADRLHERHPHLITCAITGYGPGGPYAHKKAYDLLVQCEAGLVSITGTPENPAKVGISAADIAAGMYGYSGVLAALYERERTGHARSVEVSLFDALSEWMSFPLYYTGYGGRPLQRSGARHATIAPYGPFATGDGTIQLGIQNDREWTRFCADVLERAELAGDARFTTNSRRAAHVQELQEAVEAVFTRLSTTEVLARLDKAQIANARMNTVADLAAHPQLKARERWREVGSPVGPLRALLPPVTITGTEPRMDSIPAVGEHTNAILRALGYDDGHIGRLRAQGAV